MKNKYIIKYSKLFFEDLDKIINYISKELGNKNAANSLLNEIEEYIVKRSEYPECFEKYISKKQRKSTYYRIYVKNYIIFYVVNDNVMEVRRILYGRSEFRSKLQ